MNRYTWLALGGFSLVALSVFARKSVVVERGVASWYGPGYDGNLTANGERFDKRAMTAAHKKLKFGTRVRVRDVSTGKTVDVRVNDRGPFVAGRIIDLSEGAAEVLGIKERGIADVELELL